ncbi:MAG: flagellar biosynthesis protein FlhF [Ignavibacteriales bacterium]|nr:MAG: flagellar biosynthesis protein FlhF [Ignavibacteriales bacterium]
MQIKKFVAPTLKDATEQMKSELGSDSLILSTRIIEGNNKYGKKKMFEVTAGIEDTFDKMPGMKHTAVEEAEDEKSFARELKNLSEKIYAEKDKQRRKVVQERLPVFDEISDNGNSDIEKELKEIVDTLLLREVQKPIITSILNQLKKYKSFLHSSNIDNYVVSSIASMIPTTSFQLVKRDNPKIVALVGPTGVGKTTCIAKLAVISKILHNLNIGLISIDTYRLGAIDQLRIFSEVSNIDMLVAYEPDDIPKLINQFKKKDLIFIDTAGRSQKNKEYLLKTKQYLDAAKVDETYLVMSATSTTKTLFDVAENFKLFNYKALMFTKIDEAVALGNVLNMVSNFKVPTIFLANGQVIPDDIISADAEFIAKMIYTGKFSK